MYNLPGISVILQQAKKKPLVTEVLPVSSYTWGWRCRVDYGRYFAVGQVSSRNHRQKRNGDRRWFLSVPHVDNNPIGALVARFRDHQGCYFTLSPGIERLAGYFRALLPGYINEESQVLAYLAFRNFYVNCIFR